MFVVLGPVDPVVTKTVSIALRAYIVLKMNTVSLLEKKINPRLVSGIKTTSRGWYHGCETHCRQSGQGDHL